MNSRIGLLTGIALLSASSAFAKPIEIRETQRIDLITNGSADFDAWDVDIDTTGIIVGGRREHGLWRLHVRAQCGGDLGLQAAAGCHQHGSLATRGNRRQCGRL